MLMLMVSPLKVAGVCATAGSDTANTTATRTSFLTILTSPLYLLGALRSSEPPLLVVLSDACLIELRPGVLDHVGPLGELMMDHLAKLLGRAAAGLVADHEIGRAHVPVT